MSNINYNRDLMITAIEVSKASKVPMLFLANPGFGKTTVINEYAAKNGYHVESLIGSSFDRAEVLGYMVNRGGDCLEVLEPQWFHEIMEQEKNKIPSILFIDEISTAPNDVQGSLYRLIFERTIGNGKKLPDDCIILSAANYKGNLPSQFSISAPSLNRFCLVNLAPQSAQNMIDEFCQTDNDMVANWPKFDYNEVTAERIKKIYQKSHDMFSKLFTAYSEGTKKDGDSSKGALDITNKNFDDIYEAGMCSTGEVLNFISGRTMNYYTKCIKAACEIGLSPNNEFLKKMADGLIGIGTNSFTNPKALNSYRATIKQSTMNLMKELSGNAKEVEKAEKLFTDTDTINSKVAALSTLLDNTGELDEQRFMDNFMTVYNQIVSEYPDKEIFGKLQTICGDNVDPDKAPENIAKFQSDISAIETLSNLLSKVEFFQTQQVALQNTLKSVIQTYKFYSDFAM
jgi:hypothetical protein